MNTVLKRNVPSDMPEMTAIGGEYYLTAAADDKMLIIVNASAAGTVTIAKGDAKWGAKDDLDIVFEAAGSKAIAVESARYVITKGDNRGKIKITGNGSVGCVVLP